MYDIVFNDKRVKRQFDKLHSSEQKEINSALETIKENPFNSEKLSGDLTGHWSLHAGRKLRAIYTIEKNTIVIRAVGPHEIYEEYSRYLRQFKR